MDPIFKQETPQKQRSPRNTVINVRSLLLDSDDDDFDQLMKSVRPRTLGLSQDCNYLSFSDEDEPAVGECLI